MKLTKEFILSLHNLKLTMLLDIMALAKSNHIVGRTYVGTLINTPRGEIVNISHKEHTRTLHSVIDTEEYIINDILNMVDNLDISVFDILYWIHHHMDIPVPNVNDMVTTGYCSVLRIPNGNVHVTFNETLTSYKKVLITVDEDDGSVKNVYVNEKWCEPDKAQDVVIDTISHLLYELERYDSILARCYQDITPYATEVFNVLDKPPLTVWNEMLDNAAKRLPYVRGNRPSVDYLTYKKITIWRDKDGSITVDRKRVDSSNFKVYLEMRTWFMNKLYSHLQSNRLRSKS